LEKDRTRRYETAADLARDIERHLADEPVHARPPSRVYRLRKFVKKHRVGVAAMAAITSSLAAGTVIAAFGWASALKERNVAAHQRDRATSNLRLACGLVDNVLTPTADALLSTASIQEQHARLIDAGVEFYRGLLQEAGDDALVRAGLAKALIALGGQRFHRGEDRAQPTLEAIDMLKSLVAEFPDTAGYRVDLARACLDLCFYHYTNMETAPALRMSGEALRVASELRRRAPSDPSFERLLANCKLAHARSSQYAGNYSLAETLYREGLALGARPLDAHIAREEFSGLLMDTGRFDEAAAVLHEAREQVELLPAATEAERLVQRFWRCNVRDWLATYYLRTGNLAIAKEHNDLAIRHMEELGAELPQVFWDEYCLGLYHYTRAERLVLAGRIDDAARSMEAALGYWNRPNFAFQHHAAFAHNVLGQLRYEEENLAEANEHFAMAAQGLEAVARARPSEVYCNERLVVFLSNCPSAQWRDPSRAVRIAERVQSDSNGLMWLYQGLARYRAGDWHGAQESLQKSISLRSGGDALDWLLFAASQLRAGDKATAIQSYRQAQDAISRAAPIRFAYGVTVLDYQRIRAEVEALFQDLNQDSNEPEDFP
jgi:tetratricopeptide (TPR) repeat protein